MPTPATCSAGPGGTEAADEHRAINRGPSTGHRSEIVEPAGIADASAGPVATPRRRRGGRPPLPASCIWYTDCTHLPHNGYRGDHQIGLGRMLDVLLRSRIDSYQTEMSAGPGPDARNPSDWPQARPHLGAPNLRGPELGCLPIPLLMLPAPLRRPLGTRPRHLIPGSHAHLRGSMLPGDARRPSQVGREAYDPLEVGFSRKFMSPGVPPFHQPGIHLCIGFTEEVIAGRASR